MEHKELKSKVGKSATKIWDAYQEALEELKAKEGPVLSTLAVAKKEKTSKALKTASNIDVENIGAAVQGLVDNISSAKEEYEDLQTAISAKRAELMDVHRLEAEANSLVAIAVAKDELVARKEEEAKTIILKAEERAAILVDTAKENSTNIAEEAANNRTATKMIQARQEEEWNYTFGRSTRQQEDLLQDDLNLKIKKVEERQELVSDREKDIDTLDVRIETLEALLQAEKDFTANKILDAIEKTKKGAAQSAAISKAMDDKGHKAEVSIATARIETLTEPVTDLHDRLETANDNVLRANDKVASMAQSALKAGADAATVARVSEIAAGSGKK